MCLPAAILWRQQEVDPVAQAEALKEARQGAALKALERSIAEAGTALTAAGEPLRVTLPAELDLERFQFVSSAPEVLEAAVEDGELVLTPRAGGRALLTCQDGQFILVFPE